VLWIGGVALLLCMLGIRYLLPRARDQEAGPKPEARPEPEKS
jgi:hypothetical protein